MRSDKRVIDMYNGKSVKVLSCAHRFGTWEVACMYNDASIFAFKVGNVKHPLIDDSNRAKVTYFIVEDAKVNGMLETMEIREGRVVDYGGNWTLPEGVKKTVDLISYAIRKYNIQMNGLQLPATLELPTIVSPETQ